jgi:hypothetical protein
VNLNFSGTVVLDFKDFSHRNACKNGFLYCGPYPSQRTMILINLFLCYMSESFFVNFKFSGSVILDRKINDFPYIKHVKMVFIIVAQNYPWGL